MLFLDSTGERSIGFVIRLLAENALDRSQGQKESSVPMWEFLKSVHEVEFRCPVAFKGVDEDSERSNVFRSLICPQ